MKRFYIIAKTDNFSQGISNTLRNRLQDIGLIEDKINPELLIVCGGDGKVLRTLHNYIKMIDRVKVMSIMTGTLGFSCDFVPDELDKLVESIKNETYSLEKHFLLKVTISRTRGNKDIFYALNEFRVENRFRTCVAEVYLNNELFETFRGNGLIISSPFGSTAYNRSLGGAIVMPSVKVMQLTEIAGIHHNLYRSLNSPLILDDSIKIKLKVHEPKKCILGVDHIIANNDFVNDITIELAEKGVTFIHYKPISFLDRLKKAYIVEK